MSIKSNIVHKYFKKEIQGSKILIKVDPVHLTGLEMIVRKDSKLDTRHLDFDELIYEDLAIDGFEEVSGMEFNLHLSGLI